MALRPLAAVGGPTGSPMKRVSTVPVSKLVVVGRYNAEVLDGLLAHFRLVTDVKYSADGSEFLENVKECVFLFERFEGAAFEAINSRPGARIISLTLMQSRFRKELELMEPTSTRDRVAIYCEVLKEVQLKFDGAIESKGHLIMLAHFMGAGVKRRASGNFNHLVALSPLCEHYRIACSLGYPILRPDWIEYMWSKRDDPEYVLTEDEMRPFLLRPFEGLRIFFVSFDEASEDFASLTKSILNNKGEVVTEASTATHIVYNIQSQQEIPRIESHQGQKHVTAQWLWQSVSMDACADETTYIVNRLKKGGGSSGVFSPLAGQGGSSRSIGGSNANSRRSRSSSGVLLDTSNSSVLSDTNISSDNITLNSPKRIDQRNQVAHEMLATEESYLKALGLVMKFKEALEEEQKYKILSEEKITRIFKNFEPIIKLHTKICAELRSVIDNWRPESTISQIWSSKISELKTVYVRFMSTFDVQVKEEIDTAMKENQRFLGCLKATEHRPEFNRLTMRDLIIRPVQRLPSVMLLLQQLDKRTDNRHPDKKGLDAAKKAIDEVLQATNGTRAKNDEYQRRFELWDEILNLPNSLISSSREVIRVLTATCIGGTGAWKGHENRQLRFILCNDIIIVVKVRSDKSVAGGTISRLTRALSMSNMRNSEFGSMGRGTIRDGNIGEGGTFPSKNIVTGTKKYRFIRQLEITSMRAIYENNFWDGSDAPDTYSICTREVTDDDEIILEPLRFTPNDDMTKFLNEICDVTYKQTGRDINITPRQVANMAPEVVEIIRKNFYKSNSSALNSTMSLFDDPSQTMMLRGDNEDTFMLKTRGSGGFRRALSNASLTISNKLRGGSRVNLKSIYEDSPGSSSGGGNFLPERPFPPGGRTSASPPQEERSFLGDATVFRTPSRHHRTMTSSLRSLFSSKSNLRRKESMRENPHDENVLPSHRHSTQV